MNNTNTVRFQFHKGTIKTMEQEENANIAWRTFQFHKGTIKTSVLNQIMVQQYEFQFHKGTIKTLFVVITLLLLINYFNSIKVRLKQRLRLCGFSRRLFQFHKGTIKTTR